MALNLQLLEAILKQTLTFKVISPFLSDIIVNENKFKETQKFDSAVIDFLSRHHYTGCTLGIAKGDGTVIYSQGYGATEEGVPLKSNSVLPASSISKLITAIAVMKLVEEGQLTPFDFVFGDGGVLEDLKPFPSFEIADERLFNIRIIHLLQHTSGIQSRMAEMNDIQLLRGHMVLNITREMGLTGQLYLRDVIRYSAGQPLLFSPGSRYSHSNLGYSILGEIIAKKSGLSYSEFVRQQILEPLGMWRTELVSDVESDPYKYKKERVDISGSLNLQPSLGWRTTVYDLLRLMNGLEKGVVLTSESRKEMMAPPLSPVSEHQSQWYGMGVHVGTDGSWWQTGDPLTNEVLIFQSGSNNRRHSSQGLRWVVLLPGNQHRNLKSDFAQLFGSHTDWPTEFPEDQDCEDISFHSQCGGRALINTEVSIEKFKAFSNVLLQRLFRPKWISVYNKTGAYYVSSLWQKMRTQAAVYQLEADKSGNDLQKRIDELRSKNLFLNFLEPYYQGHQLKFIAVFSSDGTGYQRYSLGTTDSIFNKSKQLYADDLSLTPTEKAVFMDGERRIVSFMFDRVNVTSWRIYDAVPVEDVKSLVMEMARHGKTLAYIHSYNYHGSVYFSTIFSDGSSHGMHLEVEVDQSVLQNGMYNMKGRGFTPKIMCSYILDNAVKFLILWTKDYCV